MSLVEILRDAKSRPLVSEDGEPVRMELFAGLEDRDIDRFAAGLPCPLPGEIRELLRFSRGFSGLAADPVDFTGGDHLFEMPEVFPHALPIAADGYGNYWVVDLFPDSESWGPIYFACHDPAVVLLQSPTLEHFLTELVRMETSPYRSLVDDVHEDRLFEVWRRNPGVREQVECLSSTDPVIAGFARELDDSFQLIDLRDAGIGFGFSWGRYGPRTVVRRYGALPVFAYQKKGLLRRLLGR